MSEILKESFQVRYKKTVSSLKASFSLRKEKKTLLFKFLMKFSAFVFMKLKQDVIVLINNF